MGSSLESAALSGMALANHVSATVIINLKKHISLFICSIQAYYQPCFRCEFGSLGLFMNIFVHFAIRLLTIFKATELLQTSLLSV